jgi:predicted double-glycine peptidase
MKKILALAVCTFCLSSFSYALDTQTYAQNVANYYHLDSIQNLTLLPVTSYQQTLDYTCGPSAVMSLLHHYGMLKDDQMTAATEIKIAKEMGTSESNGTSPKQMASWLQKNGFKVKLGLNGNNKLLIDNLKKGIPTLIEWIDWGGHWVVVTGYFHDKTKGFDNILLADPAAHFDSKDSYKGITLFNAERFESMWFDAQYFNPGHLVKGVYIIATPSAASNKLSD